MCVYYMCVLCVSVHECHLWVCTCIIYEYYLYVCAHVYVCVCLCVCVCRYVLVNAHRGQRISLELKAQAFYEKLDMGAKTFLELESSGRPVHGSNSRAIATAQAFAFCLFNFHFVLASSSASAASCFSICHWCFSSTLTSGTSFSSLPWVNWLKASSSGILQTFQIRLGLLRHSVPGLRR